MMIFLLIDFALMGILSLVTFVLYGYDKRQAKIGGRRIPEARLHAFALLGGFPGAYAGQQYFRHKTRKILFQIVIGIALVLRILIWCVIGSMIR